MDKTTLDPAVAGDPRIQNFFESFNGFSYQPGNSPQVEFERLCAQRKWGDANLQKHTRQFHTILAKTVTSPTSVHDFFRKFEFQKFKFNPSADVQQEFERLCKLRQWGTGKVEKAQREFQEALLKQSPAMKEPTTVAGSGKPMEDFFKKYEFPKYKLDPQAPPSTEFNRLCQARQWGTKKLARAREEFQRVLLSTQQNPMAGPSSLPQSKQGGTARTQNDKRSTTASSDQPSTEPPKLRPLAQFFTNYNCQKYRYIGREPLAEFKDLTEKITKPAWNKLLKEERLADFELGELTPGQKPRYYKSRSYKMLRASFHEAVEEEFDAGVKRRAQLAGLEPYEYVVELLQLGRAPMSEEVAKSILAAVNVNIYDFIDYENALLVIEEAQANSTEMPPAQQPPKPPKYPSEQVLGVYCLVANRIYPLEDARKNGTLILLLKSVGKYFKETAVLDVLLTAERLMKTPGPVNKLGGTFRATFRVVTKSEGWLRGKHQEAEEEIEDWLKSNLQFVGSKEIEDWLKSNLQFVGSKEIEDWLKRRLQSDDSEAIDDWLKRRLDRLEDSEEKQGDYRTLWEGWNHYRELLQRWEPLFKYARMQQEV